jgi:acetolactate synthase I/II/III large subunit
MLIAVLNDGAYGAEVHKLVAANVDASETIFGRPNLAGVASALGLSGTTVTSAGELQGLFDQHMKSEGSSLWDIHISPNIPSRMYRRLFFGEV